MDQNRCVLVFNESTDDLELSSLDVVPNAAETAESTTSIFFDDSSSSDSKTELPQGIDSSHDSGNRNAPTVNHDENVTKKARNNIVHDEDDVDDDTNCDNEVTSTNTKNEGIILEEGLNFDELSPPQSNIISITPPQKLSLNDNGEDENDEGGSPSPEETHNELNMEPCLAQDTDQLRNSPSNNIENSTRRSHNISPEEMRRHESGELRNTRFVSSALPSKDWCPSLGNKENNTTQVIDHPKGAIPVAAASVVLRDVLQRLTEGRAMVRRNPMAAAEAFFAASTLVKLVANDSGTTAAASANTPNHSRDAKRKLYGEDIVVEGKEENSNHDAGPLCATVRILEVISKNQTALAAHYNNKNNASQISSVIPKYQRKTESFRRKNKLLRSAHTSRTPAKKQKRDAEFSSTSSVDDENEEGPTSDSESETSRLGSEGILSALNSCDDEVCGDCKIKKVLKSNNKSTKKTENAEMKPNIRNSQKNADNGRYLVGDQEESSDTEIELSDTESDTSEQNSPQGGFSAIVGTIAAKRALEEHVVMPIKLSNVQCGTGRSLFSGLRQCGNVLLYGPPGTGKTSLAAATAAEAGAKFVSVSPGQCLSKYQGESERAIRQLFEDAKAREQPTMIFFDEIDALAPSRGGHDDLQAKRVLSELLLQLTSLEQTEACMKTSNAHRSIRNETYHNGGCVLVKRLKSSFNNSSNKKRNVPTKDKRGKKCKPKASIVVLAATNSLSDVDPAFLRRFHARVLIDLPNSADRAELLLHFLSDTTHELNDTNIESIVAKTRGWSGSDLRLLCREAAFKPVRRLFRSSRILAQNSTQVHDLEGGFRGNLLQQFNDIQPDDVTSPEVDDDDMLISPITTSDFDIALTALSATIACELPSHVKISKVEDVMGTPESSNINSNLTLTPPMKSKSSSSPSTPPFSLPESWWADSLQDTPPTKTEPTISTTNHPDYPGQTPSSLVSLSNMPIKDEPKLLSNLSRTTTIRPSMSPSLSSLPKPPAKHSAAPKVETENSKVETENSTILTSNNIALETSSPLQSTNPGPSPSTSSAIEMLSDPSLNSSKKNVGWSAPSKGLPKKTFLTMFSSAKGDAIAVSEKGMKAAIVNFAHHMKHPDEPETGQSAKNVSSSSLTSEPFPSINIHNELEPEKNEFEQVCKLNDQHQHVQIINNEAGVITNEDEKKTLERNLMPPPQSQPSHKNCEKIKSVLSDVVQTAFTPPRQNGTQSGGGIVRRWQPPQSSTTETVSSKEKTINCPNL